MKAVVYTRFSPRKNAGECESCETQFDLCKEYCDKNDMEIVSQFEDKALSGSDASRPGLWESIDELKRDYVLVVYRLDRLARSVYLSNIIERAVTKKGATIISISGEGTWNDTDEDWLVRKILQTLAEFECKVIGARTKAAMLRHQANGRRMSFRVPYGYKVDPEDSKRIIPHPIEKHMIVRVKHFRALGFSLNEVITILKAEGYKTRKRIKDGRKVHSKWHTDMIRKMLKR